MNTQNLISTPDITGNIGSCTTQVVTAESKRINLWKTEYTTIATNSCTGGVKEFTTYNYTFFAFFSGLAAVVIGFSVIKLFITVLTPKDKRESRSWYY